MKLLCGFTERNNLHKSAKSACEYIIIKHFRYVCVGASFSLEMIEIFHLTGRKKNKVCPVNGKTRLDKKDYFIRKSTNILSLWSKRKRKADPSLPVGCLFPSIPKSTKRFARCRNDVSFENLKYMESIFNCIHNYMTLYYRWY